MLTPEQINQNIARSWADSPWWSDARPLPRPPGLEYIPYQSAGIYQGALQLHQGRHAVGCFDAMGLGKTIQAIGIANTLGRKRLMVVCPASLCENWAREIEKWHICNPGIEVVAGGSKVPKLGRSVVVSYNQTQKVRHCPADLVILDEAHYLKTFDTQRTQLVLGSAPKKWPGLVGKAQTVALSGTPSPNGKPNEIWPILRRCAPDLLGPYIDYDKFVEKFCRYTRDPYDGSYVIYGARNTEELYRRLRGSGFMIRRLKEDVLKQLPPKRHKMVVFTPTRETREVLEQEKAFSAQEILDHGEPADFGETRKEMGLAKLPQSLNYIKTLLSDGTQKLVVFAHHVEVAHKLQEALSADGYPAVRITGDTPVDKRQGYVDQFQRDHNVRVLIGNLQAAGVGYTLTAAHDVVFVEASWVPGENDQAADRVHRIGQLNGVLMHFLVVQGSLDAKILSSAARKRKDSSSVLDGR